MKGITWEALIEFHIEKQKHHFLQNVYADILH